MGKASKEKWQRRLAKERGAEVPSPQASGPAKVPPIDFWKTLASHPVVPIVMGTLMTLDGPGNIGVKAGTIFACAGWLSIDLWQVFRRLFEGRSEAAARWKNTLYCLSCSLIGLLAVRPAYWLLGQHFEEEQSVVRQYLNAEAITPPQVSPMDTAFTVANPSNHTIGQHNMMCYANLVTRDGGIPYLQNILLASKFFKTELSADGGKQTYDCLSHVLLDISREDVGCLDVTLLFDYTLADQPDLTLTKYFRFVSTRAGGFIWQAQNTDDPTEFCKPFVNERMVGSSGLSITPPALISRKAGGLYVLRSDR
jgi:hypothetical protein